jgi:hypothetical protein
MDNSDDSKIKEFLFQSLDFETHKNWLNLNFAMFYIFSHNPSQCF